jgi:hypothetical protein
MLLFFAVFAVLVTIYGYGTDFCVARIARKRQSSVTQSPTLRSVQSRSCAHAHALAGQSRRSGADTQALVA